MGKEIILCKGGCGNRAKYRGWLDKEIEMIRTGNTKSILDTIKLGAEKYA